MNLLAESFQRDLLLKDLKIWLSHHSSKFVNTTKNANNAITSEPNAEAETQIEIVEIDASVTNN
jgi:hypothetical protein